MDIITFSQELEGRMKLQMESVHDPSGETLISAAKVVRVVGECIAELEQFTRSYTFKHEREEIQFFKELRPVFVSQYLYHAKLLSIKMFEAYNDVDSCKRFYGRTLKALERFARKNWKFYIYMMSGSTTDDAKYFARNRNWIEHISDYPTIAAFDYKLAKLLANELIKQYIQQVLRRQTVPESQIGLPWTASKTSLVELGVALQAVGAFNHSNADLKHILAVFEKIFKVDLKNYYRIYLQIKDRKKGQATFLDQLKDRLIQKINEDEE